ncbi:hypothetical protein M885DRAFT_625760 [Pelagophyceae sp. CCMP2097]|nr:hypothetical protein M885DRAFT_625760 [Pelagophyceae sp. CCMP2097]
MAPRIRPDPSIWSLLTWDNLPRTHVDLRASRILVSGAGIPKLCGVYRKLRDPFQGRPHWHKPESDYWLFWGLHTWTLGQGTEPRSAESFYCCEIDPHFRQRHVEAGRDIWAVLNSETEEPPVLFQKRWICDEAGIEFPPVLSQATAEMTDEDAVPLAEPGPGGGPWASHCSGFR